MTTLTLKAQKRTVFGKQSESLRRQGLIPAVLYGKKTPACSLQVDAQDFKSVYKEAGDTDIINLVIQGSEKEKEEAKNVLIQSVGSHFLDGAPLNIDFFEVEMDKPITARIPVNWIGESPAVKLGGVLVKSISEIEVEALPMDIPHAIDVDISSLQDFKQTIYVKDLVFSDQVKVLVDANTPVVTVNEPLSEEELEKELGETKSVEDVEVEGEKKEGEEASAEEKGKKEGQSGTDKSPAENESSAEDK